MENHKDNKYPSVANILWKIVLIVFASIGVYSQAKLDGGLFRTHVFLYFTIMSNMGTAIVFVIFFALSIIERHSNKYIIPYKLFTIKYMFTIAMTITLVVSSCLLAPFRNQAYLLSLRNLSLHIFAPVAAVIDFLVFDKRFSCRKRTCFLGFIIPFIYLAITLLLSIKGISYSNGTNYPYYFLDYRTLGWLNFRNGQIGVVWWLVLIAAITFVVSFTLTGIKIMINKHNAKLKAAH